LIQLHMTVIFMKGLQKHVASGPNYYKNETFTNCEVIMRHEHVALQICFLLSTEVFFSYSFLSAELYRKTSIKYTSKDTLNNRGASCQL